MSSRKECATKIPDDENTDSGFISGPIQLSEFDAPEETDQPKSDVGDKVPSVSSVEAVDLDSGVDLHLLSEGLDDLHVDDTPTPTAERLPTITVSNDIPPLAILFQQDDDGDTQLHIATVHGCEKSVGLLIRVCPDKYLIDLANDFGHSALHLAVLSGHTVVTRMLVRAGAALGVRDLNGDTPVHLATAARNVECLQALLAPIDNQPLAKKLATVLNMKNYDGQTCVHLAATAGHRPTLQTLMFYGADINAREGMAGWTPLHITVRRGDARLTQFLIQSAGVDLNARDYATRTPKRLAKRMKSFTAEEAQRLLAALPDDSDSESDSDDEYDSENEAEALFDRLRGKMTVASLVTN